MGTNRNKSKDAVETYKWSDPESALSRVDVRQNGKRAVAYVYAAPENNDLASLRALREACREKGWATSSDIRDGKSVLRVTGLKDKDELLTFLQAGRNVHGAFDASAAVVRDKPKPFMDKIKAHSLRASGIIYSIGNAFYIASGLARKKQAAQIGTGVAFSAGDIMVSIFGGKDDERQFKSLLTKLTRHLEKNGISIPKDSAISTEISTKDAGLAEKTYDFVHEHINKIKALAEVVGGFMYFKAGRDQGNRWKQATAVIFTAGFGSSLLIKEKKPDPDKLAHAGPLAKAWAWVQEKPLRAAGYSGLSNTLFTTIGALQERKGELAKPPGIRTDHYKYDLGASGSMFFANNLYALSNKSTGGAITSGGLVDDLYGLTAQVLNRVPDDKREAALKATVDFLGDRIEIKDTRQQIRTNLRDHMRHASQENPWFKARDEENHPAAVADAKKESWTQQVTRPENAEQAQARS